MRGHHSWTGAENFNGALDVRDEDLLDVLDPNDFSDY